MQLELSIVNRFSWYMVHAWVVQILKTDSRFVIGCKMAQPITLPGDLLVLYDGDDIKAKFQAPGARYRAAGAARRRMGVNNTKRWRLRPPSKPPIDDADTFLFGNTLFALRPW